MSYLVRSEIAGRLVNTLTANDLYFCVNKENLPKKSKIFYCFFIVSFQPTLFLKTF